MGKHEIIDSWSRLIVIFFLRSHCKHPLKCKLSALWSRFIRNRKEKSPCVCRKINEKYVTRHCIRSCDGRVGKGLVLNIIAVWKIVAPPNRAVVYCEQNCIIIWQQNIAKLDRGLRAYVPYSAVAICVLHQSLCSMQFSGHLYAAPVTMFHSVHWPHLCYICPCVPYSTVVIFLCLYVAPVPMFHATQWSSLCCTCPYVAFSSVAISMLRLSLCSIQFSGHLYATSVPTFHAVQWPNLCYICPYVPCRSVAISVLLRSIWSIQCSDHVSGAFIHIFHPVNLPSLWCLCPYIRCSAMATSVVPLPMTHTTH